MKLICLIATIWLSSSRVKQCRHIFAVLGVVCGAHTKAKIWVRMSLPYKFSHLTSSRSTKWRFENRNNKTQPSLLIYKKLHPIHRVRIPYYKFSSPKTCCNIDKSSFKMGHTRLARFFSLSNASMTPEGRWYACARGRLEILWLHKHANEENTLSFGEISWKFVNFMV